MTGPLTMILKGTPKNDDVETVYAKLQAQANDEEGTLTYRLFRQDDGTVWFYDDYVSSEAFLAHFASGQSSGNTAALMDCCDFSQVTVLGTPSDAAREILDGFGATYANHVAGFSRLGRMQATA